jgi:cytoskeleton protein RodZ
MDNTPEATYTTDATIAPTVGSVLRKAREEQGLTVADIAERIKFSVKQVEALDSDNLSVLPQGTFLRGFVRSYARTLHIDEVPLMAMMTPLNEVHDLTSGVQAGGLEFMPVQDSNKQNRYLLLAAFLVAVGLALFIWNQKDEALVEQVVVHEVKLPEMISTPVVMPATSSVSPASAVVISEVKMAKEAPTLKVVNTPKLDTPKVVTPKVDTPKVGTTKVDIPKVVASPTAVTPMKTVEVKPKVFALPLENLTDEFPIRVESKPKVVVIPPVVSRQDVVVEKTSLPLDQLKKRPIHVEFSQDTWMEIVDTNGEMLLSRMNLAGTQKWIGGGRRAPYKVAIGKTDGVKVFYKGREVDLSKYNQTGTVRFVLE